MIGKNEKLFKKLNERVEINAIKNSTKTLSEEEKHEIETKVVFERSNTELAEALNFTESK